MLTRAGIVGPSNTVELVLEIAEEYKGQLKVVPFVYKNPNEAVSIVNENQHLVDIWVFAGPVLYPIVKESSSSQPFFFLQLDGASLTKTMIERGYKDKKDLQSISIDILNKRDVYETFLDLGLQSDSIYSQEFEEGTPVEDLLNFHKTLFHENKVETCFTCLFSIYEQLQTDGISVYYITPTRTNIREKLSSAIQSWETKYFKESQISILLIKMDRLSKRKDASLSYEEHRLNLELQSAVIDFSESISGSFVNLGTDTFILFSTRGALNNSNEHVVDLLEKVNLITDNPTYIGVGYGDTALVAEENARISLQHARNYAPFSAFLIDAEGIIEGPLSNPHSITFGYRMDMESEMANFKLSGITITTFNKILSIQNQMKTLSITASDISKWLKMTQRNARRILNELVDQGYAEVVGEEALTTKGRPRKIYRIKIESLQSKIGEA